MKYSMICRKIFQVVGASYRAAIFMVITLLTFALSQPSWANEDDFEASFEEGLEDVSEGYGRFRYGFLFSLGLEGGSSVDIPNTTESFELTGMPIEVGGYTMVSAIQDVLDVEVGTTYNFHLSSNSAGRESSSTDYLSFYVALVGLPAEDYGVSLGYVYVSSVLDPQITTTALIGGDPLYADIIGGSGLFIEYQAIGSQGSVMGVKLQYTNLTVGNSSNSLDVGTIGLSMVTKYN